MAVIRTVLAIAVVAFLCACGDATSTGNNGNNGEELDCSNEEYRLENYEECEGEEAFREANFEAAQEVDERNNNEAPPAEDDETLFCDVPASEVVHHCAAADGASGEPCMWTVRGYNNKSGGKRMPFCSCDSALIESRGDCD